ncbi:hypothetical protein CCH79_00017532, partial [Gambusia affinis]
MNETAARWTHQQRGQPGHHGVQQDGRDGAAVLRPQIRLGVRRVVAEEALHVHAPGALQHRVCDTERGREKTEKGRQREKERETWTASWMTEGGGVHFQRYSSFPTAKPAVSMSTNDDVALWLPEWKSYHLIETGSWALRDRKSKLNMETQFTTVMLDGGGEDLNPITITETVLFLVQYTSKEFDRSEKTVATGDCCYLNPLVRRTFRFLGVYAFGLFTVDIFVNAGQAVTGNLAPYFLTVCKPNYTALGCQQALRYISHQEACTGNQDDVLKARKTFPSKEAALSIYAALYLAMYVTCTVQAKGTRLAKPVMSLGFMCLAFLTGLNRVAEYRNHWSDVIAGFIIGMAIATFLVVCVVHNFKGKLLLNDDSPAELQPNAAMLNMGHLDSPLEKYIASQETDDEDEESCYIKECLHVFLRWLRGLSWFQHLRNKRQKSFDLVWKMISRQICFLLFPIVCICFCCLVTPINQPPEVGVNQRFTFS